MWNINQNTEDYDGGNGNFSSFNRIKRSSFVRSDDAVETIERHAEYKESTAQSSHP